MTTTTTARALLRAWFDFTAPTADRTAARLALADLAEESGLDVPDDVALAAAPARALLASLLAE